MVRLRYDEGTIRVDGEGAEALDSLSFVRRDDRSESRRAPAFRYPFLRQVARRNGYRKAGARRLSERSSRRTNDSESSASAPSPSIRTVPSSYRSLTTLPLDVPAA